jgi:hypothetical protein
VFCPFVDLLLLRLVFHPVLDIQLVAGLSRGSWTFVHLSTGVDAGGGGAVGKWGVVVEDEFSDSPFHPLPMNLGSPIA